MIIPSGAAQVNWHFAGNGLPHGAECTIGVVLTSYGGDANNLAEDMYGHFSDTLLPAISGDVTMTECSTKFGPNATGPMGTFAGTDAGGDASAGASSAVAYLLKKVTNQGGRAGRGRMYLPGVNESKVNSNGAVTSTQVTILQDAANAFLTGFGAFDLTPCLLHSADSPLSGTTQIITIVADSTVATQRRRQRR